MIKKSIFAAAVIAASGLTTVCAHAKSDTGFLTDAMKGDNSEIALGKIAVDKGGSKGVRSFGHTLVTDHSKAKREAEAVARNMNVKTTDAMTDEARQERKKLDGLSGAAFDHEFASYMVSDHKKDIAKFEAESKEGSGSTAKLAKKTLPTLRKHLQIAESLDHR